MLNDKENIYFISYLDKELTRFKPTNPMDKFSMVLSDVVNIIEVIKVLNNSTEYNEHISNEIDNSIRKVIKDIHSLTECGDEYSQFLSYQSFETIRIFLLYIQKMINIIKKEILPLKVPLMYIQTNIIAFMEEFESFVNFTINKMKTLSEKKDNKETKYNGYFKNINECLSIATGIIYPIERGEANQLFGVILSKLISTKSYQTIISEKGSKDSKFVILSHFDFDDKSEK
ncbi:33789_t:CDS:2 [Gigaspora margarita]|uniref:33789_t:CDS:1 n=1 Tax=Gigaspora margarita TaxID=4874 RepID=A0ABN7V0Y2_GIGMA|nr:33789_t:CDS:2 [Gigaspora margarita]